MRQPKLGCILSKNIFRILFRYRKVYYCYKRYCKSWTNILAMYLQCMFYPGISKFIVAPNKFQAAKIAQEKYREDMGFFPILEDG